MLTKDKSFYRTFVGLALALMMQQAVVLSVNLADNVMLGSYSEISLSGVAAVNQIQFILQQLVFGFSNGMIVLASQYWGKQQIEPIRRLMALAFAGAMGVAALLLALVSAFPQQAVGLFTEDAAIIAQGCEYLEIVRFSYLFFAAGMVLNSAQRSIENVRVGMVSSLTGVILNVVLNYTLIFGHFGMPRLGVAGAAIATLAARIAEFSVTAVYTYVIDKKLIMKLMDFLKPEKLMIKDYIRVAFPVVCSGANWGIAMTFQTSILGHMGSSAIAANSIANSLFQVVSVMCYGLASAAGVLVGKAVGSGDLDKLKGYVNSLQLMFLAVGVCSSLILFSLREVVLSAYAVTPEALDMARSFMNVLCITIIGTAYQAACLTGIVRGGGNTSFVFRNDLIFQWLIVLPISALAAYVWHMSPVWVFFFLKSDQLTKCLVAVWQVNSYRWVRKVTRDEAA